MKILIDYELKDKYIKQMKEVVPKAEIVRTEDKEIQKEEIVDADVLISFSSGAFFLFLLGLILLTRSRNLERVVESTQSACPVR